MYEPLFEKLVNVDKCFLSFNEVGEIIPKDTEKVFYTMHKEITECRKWTEYYIDEAGVPLKGLKTGCWALAAYTPGWLYLHW